MAGKQLGKADAEMQINFSALKKHDQDIKTIIDTASSVAHYKFNSTSGVWEKTEVEGSLFLYSRKTAPFVIIFIMNRLNKDNAKLTLTPDMEFKIQEPFLLCKASNSEIIGIWFYDYQECQRFGGLLNKFRALAKDERSLQISIMMEAQKNAKAAQESSSNGLVGMFNNAQDEYTKSRSKFQEKSTQQKGNLNNSQKKDQNKKNINNTNKIIHRGISEPYLRPETPPTVNNIKTDSEQRSPLLDKEEQKRIQREKLDESHRKEQEMLINILHGKGKNQKRPVSSGNEFDSSIRELGIGSNLMSNAGDLATCNDLEKKLISNHCVKEKAIDCAELESQFTKQIKNDISMSHIDILNRITNPTIHSNDTKRVVDNKSNESESYSSVPPNLNSLMNGMKSPQNSLGSWKSSMGTPFSSSSSNVSSATLPNDLSNQLLSPLVMTAGKGRGTTLSALANGPQNVALAANFKPVNKVKKTSETKSIFPDAPSGAALKSLMSPAAFQLTSPVTPKNIDPLNITAKNSECVITKKEFQSIMINMIQTDNEFVTKLHNAFLEKLQQR